MDDFLIISKGLIAGMGEDRDMMILTLGKLKEQMDTQDEKLDEIMSLQKTTNGRVTLLERINIQREAREEGKASATSPFSKLGWIFLTASLSLMTSVGVAVILLLLGVKR